jgi:hypothetical protein
MSKGTKLHQNTSMNTLKQYFFIFGGCYTLNLQLFSSTEGKEDIEIITKSWSGFAFKITSESHA